MWALQAWVSGSSRNELIDSISKTFYTGNPVYSITLAYIDGSTPTNVCDYLTGATIENLYISTPTLQPGITFVYKDEVGTALTGANYITTNPTFGQTIYAINSTSGLLGSSVDTCPI